ncbi:MAG: hypothetical protein KC900_13820 [Candidatus Omnitrophica bacterium]|nr:hypothetical protein [Candidatus Omnitrophota bacterium]
MNDQQFRAYIDESYAWFEQRQAALQAAYPLAQSRFGGFDQASGTLQLITSGQEELLFRYIQIASWSKAKQTFMWGWGNQTVDKERRNDSARLKELAAKTGLDLFEKPVFVADPEMAREMITLAARHLDVLGIYRVEQGELRIFLGLVPEFGKK